MALHVVKISEHLTVASQPRLTEIPELPGLGFTALINNRPDDEEMGQPSSAEEEAAARAAGLDYAHIPVVGASFGEAEIRAFQAVLAATKGAVFAHCRSGTRTLNLWAAGEVLDGRMTVADFAPLSQRTGLDLRGAQGWLIRNGHG